MVVTGKGIIESSLRVRGRLELDSAGAILRGGRLELDGTAVLHELAPGAGAGLTIALAPGSVLEARDRASRCAGRAAGRRGAPAGVDLATDVRVAADAVAA